jgi:putative two-component system response regulator
MPESPDATPATVIAPSLALGAEGSAARILVTDDRPEMLRTIDLALGDLYECEFVSNIERARVELAGSAFDLALCDIRVDGEGTLVFAEEILREHPGTAVILITDEEDTDVARRAFGFGVYGYLVEPLRPGQLLISTMNALRRRELEIAADLLRRNLAEQFQQIIDMAPIPIYVKDASQHYVVANAKADELTGHKLGQLVGHTDETITSPAGAVETASGADQLILEDGSSYDAEETMLVDGVERTYKTVKFPLVDEQREITAVCGISIDITAQREAIELRDELWGAQLEAIAELRLSRQETVERLAIAIDLHDSSTGQHVNRIGTIAAFLGSWLRLDPDRVELLRTAAPMHDVGKIGTADEILRKPGPLTADERAEMQRHTLIGHEILSESQSELLEIAATIALTHHERFDGSGYPHGLAGEDIPLEGRITAVADVFDALLSDRCYRKAMSVAEAVDVVRQGRGTQFDPKIVDVLLDHLEEALTLRT